jgi:hypothetical protein
MRLRTGRRWPDVLLLVAAIVLLGLWALFTAPLIYHAIVSEHAARDGR